MNNLIGKTDKALEKQFNFEYYLETKDDFLLGKKVDEKKLVDCFIKFNNETELKVIQMYNGVLQKIESMDLSDIKTNLLMLAEEKGIFCDDSEDDLATSYGFLCDDYFAEIMPGIMFFSGKEKSVIDFANILKKKNIEYHEPKKISEIGKNPKVKSRKLGVNEPCHCGSGKKYKKCCLDNDIKETGRAVKIDDLWDDDYLAETLSPQDIEEKKATIHMKHDEDMFFNCKNCDVKISAHNKDWHAGLCDACFNNEFHNNSD